MKSPKNVLLCFFATSMFCSLVTAQQTSPPVQSAVVPRLVNFSGKAADLQGKIISGITGATFAIYKDQYEGSPLWIETQNVQADGKGNYTIQLGATKPDGLPLDLFTSGEARWLGVAINGGPEQSRVLLLSVPYALKAADAETLGGKPLSAFQLAPQPRNIGTSTKSSLQAQPLVEQANEIVCSSSNACKTGFVPLFSTNGGSAKVTDSIVSQSGGSIAIAGNESVTSSASAPAILGTSSGTAGTSNGVQGVASSPTSSGVAGVNSSGVGVYGASTGAASNSIGVEGVTNAGSYAVAGVNNSSTNGIGVYGLSSGTLGDSAGVWGTSQTGYAPGVEGVNTSTDPNATGIYGYANSYGIEGSSPGVGIRGYSSGTGTAAHAVEAITFGNATGFYTDSSVQQARTMGGWVKAMVFYDGESGGGMSRCFNATLTGAAATTPPCGFTVTTTSLGIDIDFGFEVDDRFLAMNLQRCSCGTRIPAWLALPQSTNVIEVQVLQSGTSNPIPAQWHLIVF